MFRIILLGKKTKQEKLRNLGVRNSQEVSVLHHLYEWLCVFTTADTANKIT